MIEFLLALALAFLSAGGSSQVTKRPAAIVPPAATPGAAVQPPNHPWIGEITEFDTGYCGEVTGGHGWTGALSWPANGTIDDGRAFRTGHPGIDINLEVGTPIYAAGAGVVIWSGFSKWGGGELVVLAHGRGWQTYYAHLSEATAVCGAVAGAGELVGYSGQTGMASWPHLHFEVRRDGLSYDPAGFLEN